MPYRLRYEAHVDWFPAGTGQLPGQTGALPMAAGSAQTLYLPNVTGGQVVSGSGAGGIINGTDVTTLTNAMAADIAAQMNVAATLARLQAFATGGP